VNVLADIALVAAGVTAVVVVFDAAVRTFVLPRGEPVWFTHIVFVTVRRLLEAIAHPNRSYEARDRVMALYAPVALLALPAVWLAFVFAGFACFFHVSENIGWREAVATSGSSLLTLGFVRPVGTGSILISFVEATIGLALLALLIAYLPTIYSAFSRREVMVTELSVRAGTPPSAVRFLELAHTAGYLHRLDPVWESWMGWFNELSETHTSLAAVSFFRSPNPNRSWVTASGAILDAASLRYAVCDIPWTPEAGLCIRAGFMSLREIADFFGFEHARDPRPDDPIAITRDEFSEAYDRLAAAGVPVRADREQAWRDFAGWRVNYDAVLSGLAAHVMAPYAPWSSDRSLRLPLRARRWGLRRTRPDREPDG
jgi:hypothetical protein